MKAIILAAGMGRRLAAMGWNKPKCLLPIGKTSELVGETTLLSNLLASLVARGVKEAVLVVGYRRELVEREATRHDVACVFIQNADFATTNTIYSLFLARENLSGGFLYFNADVWFDPRVLDLLIGDSGERHAVGNSQPEGEAGENGIAGAGAITNVDGGARVDAVLVVDETSCGEEEVKVIVDDEGRVTRIGKELDPRDCAGEFIGIARFNRSICGALVAALERYCADRPAHGGAALDHGTRGDGAGRCDRNFFFEVALDDVLGAHRVVIAPLGTLRAIEIDTPEDYALARADGPT